MLPVVSTWQISSSDRSATFRILRDKQLFLIDWVRRDPSIRESVRQVKYTAEELAIHDALDVCMDALGSTVLVSRS